MVRPNNYFVMPDYPFVLVCRDDWTKLKRKRTIEKPFEDVAWRESGRGASVYEIVKLTNLWGSKEFTKRSLCKYILRGLTLNGDYRDVPKLNKEFFGDE